jgi:two-component system, NtrC family, sensor histidine kinase KinB
MTIKTKISLALTFLFAVLLLLGGLSAYYLNRTARDAQAILKDNYITLEYTSAMQKALAARPNPDALIDFAKALTRQEANVTEVGEAEATRNLRREFDRYRRGAADSLTVARLRQQLLTIDDLNRQAMIRKNDTANASAREALQWLAVVGTLCFLVLLSFIVNFPGYIANPLRELTRGIRQVASRNFEERLSFRSNDEFGELARSFNSMAQKLDEYEHSNLARVLFEKRRIDTLIQIMHEGIIGLDEQRRILFANPVACRLLGLAEAQLAGHYAPDIAAQNDLMRTLIQDLMQPQPPDAEQSRLLKIYDEGKENYFNQRTHTVAVTRTGEEQPQRAGYVIVLENVTSFKELDLAKTNFIATVSHELKTPLSGIKMSLKLLSDSRIGTLNTEQADLIEHVRADADRLLNLTGELLNMAQVESGQIQLNLQPVVPAAIVEYATNALRPQAEARQIRLGLNVPNNLPPVLADPDKASWVLVNFLSNAVRHSPEDSLIEVSAMAVGSAVEFRVHDHGAGIRPEHQGRVFDRYFKAPGLNGQASGTGLGLAISSEFIQSMNGQIGLDTTVTDGAAFYFRLPVVEA